MQAYTKEYCRPSRQLQPRELSCKWTFISSQSGPLPSLTHLQYPTSWNMINTVLHALSMYAWITHDVAYCTLKKWKLSFFRFSISTLECTNTWIHLQSNQSIKRLSCLRHCSTVQCKDASYMESKFTRYWMWEPTAVSVDPFSGSERYNLPSVMENTDCVPILINPLLSPTTGMERASLS